MDEPLISIIIPYYNSAPALRKNLPYLLENLKTKGWHFEIIIADDGSKNILELKEIVSGLPITTVFNECNMGKGEAIRRGFKTATGSIKIFTDPDIPYDFDGIERIVDLIKSGNADLVIGNRLMKESLYYDKVSWVRRLGSRFISVFLGRLVTGGYYDTQCGIKGFSKEAADKIFEWSAIKRFAIDIEIIYLALKFHYRIVRIPVKLRSTDGKTVRVFRDGFTLVRDIFRIRSNYVRKKRSYAKKR